MADTEHIATVEVSEGADGSFQAEIYVAGLSEQFSLPEMFEGFGATKHEAVKDALEAWLKQMGEQMGGPT